MPDPKTAPLLTEPDPVALYGASGVVTPPGGNLNAAYQLDAQRREKLLVMGTLNANCALTLTHLAAGGIVTIIVTQDATGYRTLTVNGAPVAVNGAPLSPTVLRVHSNGTTSTIEAPGADPPIIGACAKRVATQSIANNSTVLVAFDTEVWDTNGFINLGTSATRIVIPPGLGGHYEIAAEWAWAANNTGLRFGTVFRNGTLPTLGGDMKQANGETDGQLVHHENLVPNDYLELIVKQVSGGALNVTFDGLGGNTPRLSVRRLGPAVS